MTIQENIILAPYTVFKIGGPARYFCEVQNLDDIQEAILFAKNLHISFFVFGAGSNLLVSDDGFAGLVGGLGFACSANIGKDVAVFEPTHGSAPKYEKLDPSIVNPNPEAMKKRIKYLFI